MSSPRLTYGPVLAGLDDDLVAVGVDADRERVDLGGVDLVEVLLDQSLQAGQVVGLVAEVEVLQPVLLLALVAGDRVEVFLDAGGELVVDELVEVLLQQSDDGERGPRRHQRLALLPHVAAVLDGLDDRRPRRRPADAQLLEPLDQRRLGVARRRRGGVTVRGQRLDGDDVADGERRQQRLALVVAASLVVDRLDVHLPVAGEA